MMNREELGKIAEASDKAAADAMLQEEVERRAMYTSRRVHQEAKTRAAQLLKQATRDRIAYMRARGAELDHGEAD